LSGFSTRTAFESLIWTEVVGYRAHTQATPTLWDEALSQSKYKAINLDLGHYTAGTNESPIPFLEKSHARIVSMHMKDRKYEKNGGANLPWGTGDTPIREALQLMKKEKYKFPATIELEYPTPEGSTVMAEMKQTRPQHIPLTRRVRTPVIKRTVRHKSVKQSARLQKLREERNNPSVLTAPSGTQRICTLPANVSRL
jgi:hypothetical protein